MSRAKRIAEYFATAFVVIVIGIAAFMLVGPRFGWNTHPVLSGSMEPVLGVGGVIVTQPIPVQDVRVGDVITFQVGKNRVTHRVIEVIPQENEGKIWFRTKGDANEDSDPDIITSKAGTVPKTILYAPYVGYAANLMRSKLTYVVLIALPAIGLIAMFGMDAWKGMKQQRRDAGADPIGPPA